MVLGGIDSSKYTGAITYAPVVLRGYWEIETALGLGGATVSGTAMRAAIDTGTSLAYVPPAVATAFYAPLNGRQVSSRGYWSIPW